MSDISDTRWLETDRAVEKMDAALEEVLLDVKGVVEGKASGKDPVAIGLYSQLRSVWFIACLALFLDLMPHINAVTLAFQAREIDLSAITTLVPAVIKTVRDMIDESAAPSESHRAKLHARFDQLQAAGIELTAKRYARNPRSALAAKEALYSPRGNAPSKKKLKVAPVKRKRSGNKEVCFHRFMHSVFSDSSGDIDEVAVSEEVAADAESDDVRMDPADGKEAKSEKITKPSKAAQSKLKSGKAGAAQLPTGEFLSLALLSVETETKEDRTMTVDDRLAEFTRLVGRPFLRSVENNLAFRFPDLDMMTLGALDGLFNPQRYPEETDEKVLTHGESSVTVLERQFDRQRAAAASAPASSSASSSSSSSSSSARVAMDLTEDEDKAASFRSEFAGTIDLLPAHKLRGELAVFRNFVLSCRRAHREQEAMRMEAARKRLLDAERAQSLDGKDSGVEAKVRKSKASDAKDSKRQASSFEDLESIAGDLRGAVIDLAAEEADDELSDDALAKKPKTKAERQKLKDKKGQPKLSKKEREIAKLKDDLKERPLTLTALCQTLIKQPVTGTLIPAFFAFAQLTLSLFLHSADCERGFSLLKTIKTYLRNRLKNDTLLPLMLIAQEGLAMSDEKFAKFLDRAIDEWSDVKVRRAKV